MNAAQAGTAPDHRYTRGIFVSLVFDLILPVVLYYVLRGAGVGVYLSLLISAAIPATIAVVRLVGARRVDGLALYTVSIMVLGAVVSLIAGSPRFLLARDGFVTGVTGVWFIVSARFGSRPIAYLYSRPLLEQRLIRRGAPGDWEESWKRLPRFRRVWRIATLAWGLGLLCDAVARVVMAYNLPVDTVPALSLPLYTTTSIVLILLTNIYYRLVGLFDGQSPLYAPLCQASHSAPTAEPGRVDERASEGQRGSDTQPRNNNMSFNKSTPTDGGK